MFHFRLRLLSGSERFSFVTAVVLEGSFPRRTDPRPIEAKTTYNKHIIHPEGCTSTSLYLHQLMWFTSVCCCSSLTCATLETACFGWSAGNDRCQNKDLPLLPFLIHLSRFKSCHPAAVICADYADVDGEATRRGNDPWAVSKSGGKWKGIFLITRSMKKVVIYNSPQLTVKPSFFLEIKMGRV